MREIPEPFLSLFMPQLHLTDMAVRRLKPCGRQVFYWDTASPIALRLSQAGGKSFVVVVGEQRRKISLGKYPNVSLAEAREKGERIARERSAAPVSAAIKFSDALEGYLDWAEQHHRPSTLYEKRRVLNRHFADRFVGKQLGDINVHDIGKIFDRLGRTPSEARHAYIAIQAFFTWCCGRQYLPRSPCENLPPPARSRSRERVLSDAELSTIYKAAGDFGDFGTIVRLCIATAQRRGEIGALKWQYVDAEKQFLHLPASVVKNGKAHTLPLTPFALSLLPARGTSVYAFPARGNNDRPYNGWSKTSEKLKSSVGFSDWCLHDLRRSAASGMARIGGQPHVIERVLNHAQQGMTAIYQRHQYLDEMRSILELWSAHVQRIIGSAAA
jgi:integrase